MDFLDKWLDSPENMKKIEASLHRLEKSKKGFQRATKGLQSKITALNKKIGRGSENLLLADAANVPELSDLLTSWREERDWLQAELEAAARCPNGHDVAEITERALAHAVALRENLNSDDSALVRAVVKGLVEKIEILWQLDGDFYRAARGGYNGQVLEWFCARCFPWRLPARVAERDLM